MLVTRFVPVVSLLFLSGTRIVQSFRASQLQKIHFASLGWRAHPTYGKREQTCLSSSQGSNQQTVNNAPDEEHVRQERIAALPLPPHRKKGPFRNLRDTISHIINPERFVATRTEELGPVFLTHQFFAPTVVIGGQEAVQEFISGPELKSKVVHTALPETFQELHTKWGTLNLDATDEVFKQARSMFGEALSGRDALAHYARFIESEMELYVSDLARRVRDDPDLTVYLVPELKAFCLRVYSRIFSGEGLSDDQVQLFDDYNSALLSLSKLSPGYRRGMEALNELKGEIIRRFHQLDDWAGNDDGTDNPGRFFHDIINGRDGFEDDDRIASVIVLFIWGAYIESAALAVDSLAVLSKYDPSLIESIRSEVVARELEGGESGFGQSDLAFWSDVPLTLGVLRETLRLVPPGGGTPRTSREDFELMGYRIPSETAVMLDPRIGNKDPALYPEPERFQPMRWVPKSKGTSEDGGQEASRCPFRGTALNRGPGSWFPGGFGAHQCPGIPLAELVGKMFLGKMAKRFESWEFSGSGLTKNGEIKYEEIPIKIPPDNFGLRFKLRES